MTPFIHRHGSLVVCDNSSGENLKIGLKLLLVRLPQLGRQQT